MESSSGNEIEGAAPDRNTRSASSVLIGGLDQDPAPRMPAHHREEYFLHSRLVAGAVEGAEALDIRDLFIADRDDTIAGKEARLERGAVRFYPGDEHSTLIGKTELERELPSDSPCGEAPAPAVHLAGARLALLLGRRSQSQLLTPTGDHQLYVLSHGRVGDPLVNPRQLLGELRRDALSAVRKENVSRPHSRPFRGRIGVDAPDHGALDLLRLEVLRKLLERLKGEAEPASRDLALLDEIPRDLLHDVDGNGEADARRAERSPGVHSHDLSIEVHQGTAGVPGIDGGIGLDPGVERARLLARRELELVGEKAVLAADDAERERPLEGERASEGHHVLADVERVGVAQSHGRRPAPPFPPFHFQNT